MIQSIWQIDLINASGTTRLLDYGDGITDEIKFSVAQDATRYGPISSLWGETDAGLNAFVSLGWSRRQNHASHAASRSHCLRTAAAAGVRRSGTLRVSVQDGEVWDIGNCTVFSSEPMPLVGYGFRTLTSYQAIGGVMTPAAAIALYAGIQWDFILQNWEDLSGNWETL